MYGIIAVTQFSKRRATLAHVQERQEVNSTFHLFPKKNLKELKEEGIKKAFEEKSEDEVPEKIHKIKQDEDVLVELDEHFDWNYKQSDENSKYIEQHGEKKSSE